MCACYAVKGSLYDETAPLDTVYGAILSLTCKLNLWVTHKFMVNLSIFSNRELTKHSRIPSVLNFIMCKHHLLAYLLALLKAGGVPDLRWPSILHGPALLF